MRHFAPVNRLAHETSPYLLQHKDNPVDWYPWGPEALERAQAEDKPILLSIGYAACHWCHVMEHESFEDPATAALMNDLFVNVKVDREERPDLDAVYMDAVVALTGRGGWPMTVFLTPGQEPFYGGTYYPPEPRHGLPSFRQVLTGIARAYEEQRAEIVQEAGRLTEELQRSAQVRPSSEPLVEPLLAAAVARLGETFDTRWGGFGGAPKFPPAATLEFLLHRVAGAGDEHARAMLVETLDAMALGGMWDVLGGGFHRYSVDDRWLVPHFEKMLYDNAQLAAAYLHAWVVTGDERYRRVCELTLDYLLRELGLPEGGLASSQDADTDGVEGLTFSWTAEEIGPELAHLLEPFEHGRSVLRGELDEPTRLRLLAEREQRPKPGRDDKAVAAWNGLALAALAEAGRRLDRADYLAAATRLGDFLLGPLSAPDGRLHRSYNAGRATGTGYLEDYADVAHGLLELHVATGDLRWLAEAGRLATRAVELFADPEHGGFFLTPADGERLVARTKDLDDHPTPSGNSMLAHVLIRLARISGDDALERQAVSVFRLVRPALERVPSAFGWALCALDLHFAPPREIAIVGPPGSPVARAALAPFAPTTVVAVSRGLDDEAAQRVPLLAGKGLVGGRPAVYVCEQFACQAPVTDPAALL